MVTDWRTTEDWWGPTWGWPWDPGRSKNPLPPRAAGAAVPVAANNLTALAVCQASCPWRGGPPQRCAMGVCCPRLCRGCEAGWPYDAQGLHIGPVKLPHSNRWACHRVQWLGMRALQPCNPAAIEVQWINSSGAEVPWANSSGVRVEWEIPATVLKQAA